MLRRTGAVLWITLSRGRGCDLLILHGRCFVARSRDLILLLACHYGTRRSSAAYVGVSRVLAGDLNSLLAAAASNNAAR
jgi:hypothetical protein